MANAYPQQPNLVGGWDISEDRLVIPLPILAVGNKPVTKVEELKKESRPKWYINSWTARPGTDAMVSHALKISESCRQLSTLAFRKQLAAGDILELLEYAWEKLFAFDSTLLRTYERSNDLTRFLEHVGIWMSTNSLTERYRAFINSIYQRPRQSIVDFFEFYLVNVRPMTSGDETQWNLARTFYLRLTEEYRNERQYALDTILKPILFFHIDTGDLTNAQKSHITLDRLEQALLNPLNSTRLALPKHLAGGGGDNVLKKPRRDTDGDGGAPAPFGRGRGNFIRGTGRGRSVSGRGRGFSDRNFGGGSKQDFPASRYEAAAPPAKRSAGFACYVCGSPDHGINEHPMDDAKRAYLARRDDRGTVGRGRGFTPKPKFQQMSGKQKAESYQNQAKRLLQKAAEILTPESSSPKPERTDDSSRISNFQISEMLEMLNKRATIYVAKSGELRTVAGSEVNRDGKLVEFSGESAKHRQLLSMGYDMLPPDIFAARTEIVSSTATFRIVVALNNVLCEVLLDTGAMGTAITESQLAQISMTLDPTSKGTFMFVGLGGATKTGIGKVFNVPVSFGDVSLIIDEMYVVPDDPTYDVPMLTFAWALSVGLDLTKGSNEIIIAGISFYRGGDDLFWPASLKLQSADQFEDPAEADEGIEKIMEDYRENTLEFRKPHGMSGPTEFSMGRASLVVEGMRAHAADNQDLVVPPLPLGRPFDLEMTPSIQMDWLVTGYRSMGIDLKEKAMREWASGSPNLRAVAAELWGLLRDNIARMLEVPGPPLLDRFGKKVLFDMPMLPEWEERGYITPIRNHSAPVRQIIKESTIAYEAMGMVRKRDMGPDAAPPKFIWESVIVPTKAGTGRHAIDFSPAARMINPAPMVPMGNDLHFQDVRPEDVAYQSVADINRAFNAIHLTPGAVEKSVYRGHDGLYEFLVMIFGPQDAPAMWNNATADILENLYDFLRKHVDDLWLFASSMLKHLQDWCKLLRVLHSRNLFVKVGAKLQFLLSIVEYVGRQVRDNGTYTVTPDTLDKLLAVKNPGQDLTKVRGLLGTVHWSSDFLPGAAPLLEPFAKILRSKTWDPTLYDPVKHDAAALNLRDYIKDHVSTNRFLDVSLPIVTHSDACETGWASLLLNARDPSAFDKGFYLVAAHSALFNPTQRRWPAIRKELHSVMGGLNKFKSRIEFYDILSLNDHKPLMWLFRVALSGNGPSWAMRALLSLLCWRITLLYMPGKNHLTQLVDLFSRVWFENEPNCATIVHLRIPIPALKQGKVQIFRMNSNSIMDRSLDLSLSLPLALEQDLFAQLTSRAKNLPTNIDFDNFSPDLVATMDVRVSKYLGSLSFRGKTLFYQEEDVDRYPRLYIPLVLRDAYWAMAHSSPFAGHPGLLESINNLKRFGWYDGLREDVAERIRVCHGCQLGKKEGVTLDFVRGHTFPVGFPFAKITIDFAGEYAVTERGFKYICIVQCDDTRFRVCEACSSKAAVVAARVLVYRIFTTFGAPLIIGHDQGGEFNNGLISSINELLGMNSEMSFPYQPQVIARNERSHQEDNKIIRSIGALHEWDLLVPMLQWILNIRKNASLGMSPFRALFGRDPMRIHEVAQVAFICRELQLDPAEFQHVSVEEWAERLRTEANERRALKAAADLIADEKHRGQRGRVSSLKQYGRPQVGDMVAIRATPSKSTIPNAKLARLWLGPFEITWMSPQGLSFEMVFIPDRSIVVQRPAQDVKRYFTKDNDGSVIDATQVDDYVVSEILGARGEHHDSTREYFVSWEGWPEEFNLWIAPELINDPDLIVMADRKFPPESGSRLMKSDWMTKLIPGQIATIVDEYSNRRAPGIRILLRGENQPRKLPLHFAPEVVLKMPDVAALPGVQRFLADRHIVDV